MKKVSNISWMHILRGVLFLIVAILMLRRPLASMVAITATLGLLVAIAGIVFIVGSIKLRKIFKKWKWALAFGVLDVILGFVLLTYPGLTAPLLVVLIGSWAMAIGILEIGLSFNVKKLGIKKWWTILLIGLLSLAFGVIIIVNPVIGAISVSVFMGMQFLFYGSFLILKGINQKDAEAAKPIPANQH